MAASHTVGVSHIFQSFQVSALQTRQAQCSINIIHFRQDDRPQRVRKRFKVLLNVGHTLDDFRLDSGPDRGLGWKRLFDNFWTCFTAPDRVRASFIKIKDLNLLVRTASWQHRSLSICFSTFDPVTVCEISCPRNRHCGIVIRIGRWCSLVFWTNCLLRSDGFEGLQC